MPGQLPRLGGSTSPQPIFNIVMESRLVETGARAKAIGALHVQAQAELTFVGEAARQAQHWPKTFGAAGFFLLKCGFGSASELIRASDDSCADAMRTSGAFGVGLLR